MIFKVKKKGGGINLTKKKKKPKKMKWFKTCLLFELNIVFENYPDRQLNFRIISKRRKDQRNNKEKTRNKMSNHQNWFHQIVHFVCVY